MSNIDSLERLKLWVQIASTIAVPVVVFVIGHQVQRSIADQELGKSYVQMAIDVLKAPATPETAELRQWAVATVDKHSPIPLSKELREQLKRGTVELKAATRSSNEAQSDHQTGLVKFIKCEKTLDADTAKWLIKNFKGSYHPCPNPDEVGITQFKRREGPLKEGETAVTIEPLPEATPVPQIQRSVACIKVRDKQTADWLLQHHSRMVFKCPKSDEVGVETVKAER